MAVRKLKPTSAGRRFQTVSDFAEITRTTPEKSLTVGLTKKAGRNNRGRVTSRRRGGGVKRLYRIIDFKRNKFGIAAKVAHIDVVLAGEGADIKPGNAMQMSRIPVGTVIHNVELYPGKGGQLCRAAGTYAQLVAKEGKYALLRLPSGEVRKVLASCVATVGQVGNIQHENISLGKAGRNRWLGRRPQVRGVAMNPIDHPLGGGEGRSSGGRHPVSPWGMPAKGFKTRDKNKASSRLIIKRRGQK